MNEIVMIKKFCNKCQSLISEVSPNLFNESEETCFCNKCQEEVSFFVERVEKERQLLKD